MPREWTENQRRAIESLDRNVCVAAGAGSGKTGVLVERFLRIIRESLAGRLRLRQRPPTTPAGEQPKVGELLDVDREYREKAEAGQLPRIAPRRFNPGGEAWLPVLHTERGGRHYSALFSNTAHAHQQGTTRDWVVIYRDDDDNHGQWTVVTAKSGALRGRRVVRGREEECARHYAEMTPHAG